MSIYVYYNSKYEKWYYDIIQNAKNQNRSKGGSIYYEYHHIIPKSLGGPNTSENMVLLTGREHFICHWLLYKFCEGNNKHKMAHAWFMMCNTNNSTQKRYTPNSRIYEAAKKAKNSANVSEETRKKQSESQKGKKISPETRKKISTSMIGKIKSDEHCKNLSNSLKGYKKTPEHIKAIADSKKGLTWSEEQKENLKKARPNNGENNPIFEGWYVTPWGIFPTPKLAADSAFFLITESAIRKYCKYRNEKIITNNHPIKKEYVGKTPKQLGYGFKKKEG